jgi:adenine-specific DNA-methyltransferase
VPTYDGRLELTWTNKHLRLLAHEDGSYEWVKPTDYRVAEVRLLHDVTSVGEVGSRRAADNLLIRGDALNALTSLSRLPEFANQYLGKVKLVYIDPPFNTQQSFLHYDDALEHSVWLTMMRDRLIQIHQLLAPDGSVWVHLDDAEMAYCRTMMDEIFGRDAFVAVVVWENFYGRSNAAALSPSQNYLLVYAPMGKERWRGVRNLLPRDERSSSKYSNPDNDPRGEWRNGPIFAPEERHAGLMYTVVTPAGREVRPPAGSHWRMTEPEFWRMVEEGRITFGSGGDGAPAVKLFLAEVQDGLVPRTWWPHTEVGHSQEGKREIQALFPDLTPFATPKPERLMRRIIQIATDPGEVVLDCFVGSGTTAAVAHKMGRRWVGIERESSTVESFALPRVTKVVNGADPGGITAIDVPTGEGLPDGVAGGDSKAAAKVLKAMSAAGALDDVDGLEAETLKALVKALGDADKTITEIVWNGGGGFRLLDVAPSMFEAEDGLVFLADWMTNGKLSEATAAQLGFQYDADPPFSGRKGRTRLAVVDGVVNESVVRLLVSALPEGERVVVCGTGIDTDARPVLRELRAGSTLRKIPAALLDEYRSTRQLQLILDAGEALASETVEVSS